MMLRAIAAQGATRRPPVMRSAASAQRRALPPDDPAVSAADLRRELAARAAADPDRLAWPEDWWLRCDAGDALACRALWAAALRMLLRDALRAAHGIKGLAGETASPIAHYWIGSRDFDAVAALAGFDGAALADRLRPALADRDLAMALYDRLSFFHDGGL